MYTVKETDQRFYVKKSTLPDAGMGCFAKEKILKGDFLEIIGILVRYDSTADRCTHYSDRYKFAAEPIHEFTHSLIPMGFAAMVNQANSPEQQNVAIAHLPKDRKPRNQFACQAVYLALRDIEPDEELLGNYNRKTGRYLQDNTSWDEWEKFLKRNLYGLGEL